MIHAIHYNEEYDDVVGAHELVDVDYTCSRDCMLKALEQAQREYADVPVIVDLPDRGLLVFHGKSRLGYMNTLAIEYGAWPGGSETDYDVQCAGCGVQLWEGLEHD